MAHIEATGAEEDTPSTPPNTTAPNESTNPSQSIRRESTRLRTPSTQPGFVPTQTDSRRALTLNAPPAQRKQKRHGVGVTSSQVKEHVSSGDADDLVVTTDPFAGLKQVARRTGRHVAVDMAQDSEDENYKARKVGSKKDPLKDKDGFDHCRLYFFPPGEGPNQAPEDAAWACRWCSKEYIASGGSYYNLKAHRDGALVKKQLRGACLGREKAIAAGGNFPPSVASRISDTAEGNKDGQGTLAGYVHKGRFDNQTLNKLIVIWIIRQSLPWLRIEDFLLRVAFDYTIHTAQLHSRMWAAAQAHQLYLEQRAQVVREIKASDSKISLVSDVWTTKGSHKAFVGITVCYITSDWNYKCQHLAIKYVSWHHNGKYLAVPFANVLVKHGLHNKISSISSVIISIFAYLVLLFFHVIAQTTDSGSNNFTMAKGVAAIFRNIDATYWDVQNNHHRCACHVIALILGAGLRALKLSSSMVRPEKDDKSFPLLYTIPEEAEPTEEDEAVEADIVEVFTELNVTDEQEVDPDDAEPALPQPGWEWNTGEDEDVHFDESGIGFTLKKIDYICHRIAASPQKQAEWKLWADELKYTGKGLIGGYGIRWNIAYNSRDRAYEGRKVIKRLLENEDERLAGKSNKDHYFKAYELTSKEWEEVNNLNHILKDFLDLTKKLEGDGPKLPQVLYDYKRLLATLVKKKSCSLSTSLEPMFDPMIKITKKYVELAINCDTVVLATFLHPAWRMMLFKKEFPTHVSRITSLIKEKFEDRDIYLKSLQPETPPLVNQSGINGDIADAESDSDGDEYNFYPQNSQAIDINTEMERYNKGDFPLDKKGDVLGWWKVIPHHSSHITFLL
ncbi:hypothetical protein Pst134EA_023040 [Puccinia striiformis f. sp. tritici]|uniref:hypothetical protein n=1 Tax=Puccinia striiformis f. sp. tritici TaxID=168172 RepID=UPI0020087118|nr:hypothetical protein Pst134EA_023040 [Puccinia striiformis f. sp. tritici]KAH9455581.1 hypothetical protein Pst134EA_023040 [Puccinia striiformis f. sp. tritici]